MKSPMGKLVSWTFLAAFVSTPSTFGKDVELFDRQNHHSEKYNDKILSVQPGDTIVCGSQTYSVVRRLGAGNTTQIFDIGSDLAVRVPKADGLFNDKNYLHYVIPFQNANEHLKNFRVATVDFHRAQSVSGRCLVVSKYTKRFSLGELIKYRLKGDSKGLLGLYGETISDFELETAFLLLEDFVRSTWKIANIHDLHVDNVIFTTEGWIAADYTGVDQVFEVKHQRTIIQAWKSDIPAPALYRDLEAAVLNEREKNWNLGEPSPALSKSEMSELLRQKLPHFNKNYFMNLRPEEMIVQSREVLRAVPRVWFIEKFLEGDGENYFMKLPAKFRTELQASLRNSGQKEDLRIAERMFRLSVEEYRCTELASEQEQTPDPK